MVLQCIKPISVTGGVPTIALPLYFVLAVNAIKDALEDLKRRKSDNLENKQNAVIIQTRIAEPDTQNLVMETHDRKWVELALTNDSDMDSMPSNPPIGMIGKMRRSEQELLTSDALKQDDSDIPQDLYRDDDDAEFLTERDISLAPDGHTRMSSDSYMASIRTDEYTLWKNKLHKIHWQDIQPGDLVVIFHRDICPADGIILACSDDRETVFIETSSLDGETSLKIKKPILLLNRLVSDAERSFERTLLNCASLSLIAQVEQPSSKLVSFRGTCHVGRGLFSHDKWDSIVRGSDDAKLGHRADSAEIRELADAAVAIGSEPSDVQAFEINKDNLLLRGSRVCHTQWAVLLVAYTGNETKIRLNSAKPQRKDSKLEKRTHMLVILMFGIMVSLCAIAASGTVWVRNYRRFSPYKYTGFDNNLASWYNNHKNPLSKSGKLVIEWVISFFTWILLLTNLVPISLVVSMGLVRSFQAWHMSKDIRMLDENQDGCVVRTSGLNDELGIIKYIATDKTGTLTANIMEFNKCAIGKHVFGDDPVRRISADPTEGISIERNQNITPHCSCQSVELEGVLAGSCGNVFRQEALMFFIHLAANHSALVDDSKPDVYIASSPDEEALIYGACHFGIKFVQRLGSGLILDVQGRPYTITVEHFYSFDSDRKRSTIVVSMTTEILRPDLELSDGFLTPRLSSGEPVPEVRDIQQRYYVFVKGADSHVLPLCVDTPQETNEILTGFAQDCLRTLVLGCRELSKSELLKWKGDLHQAIMSGDEAKIMDTASFVEEGLKYQGVTGIEDLLAPEVPETIEALSKAGIRIWMLTGDKFETAFNIGVATNLVKPDSQHIVLTEEKVETVDNKQLELIFDTLQNVVRSSRGAASDKKSLVNPRTDRTSARAKLATLWSKNSSNRASTNHIGRETVKFDVDNQHVSREEANSYGQSTLRTSLLARVASKLPKEHNDQKPNRGKTGGRRNVTVIWDGVVLRRCLSDEKLRPYVWQVTYLCDSAIFCRTSPQDKGDVVRLLREFAPKATCLAVGDGANDCNMLTAADVGVGIKGREGLQAFNSSDYGLTEFRHLRPLLLIHGRWNYRRLVKMVLHTFYKNFVFCMPTYYFAFYSLFSGQKTFSEPFYQLYNVALTQLPVVCYGIWDQDVNAELSLAFPQLYKSSPNLMRKRSVCFWLLCGIWHSIAVYFMPIAVLTGLQITDTDSFRPNDYSTVSTLMFTQIMIVVNGKLLLETMCPSSLTLLALALSFLVCYLITYTMSTWITHFAASVGTLSIILRMPMTYVITATTPVIALSIDILVAVFDRSFKPELHHLMQFLMRFEKDERRAKRQLMVEAVKQGGPQLLQAMGFASATLRSTLSLKSGGAVSNRHLASVTSQRGEDEDITAALAVHDKEKNKGGMTDVLLEVLQLKPLLQQIKGGFAFSNPDVAVQALAFSKSSVPESLTPTEQRLGAQLSLQSSIPQNE